MKKNRSTNNTIRGKTFSDRRRKRCSPSRRSFSSRGEDGCRSNPVAGFNSNGATIGCCTSDSNGIGKGCARDGSARNVATGDSSSRYTGGKNGGSRNINTLLSSSSYISSCNCGSGNHC